MQTNTLKRILQANEPAFGVVIRFPSPAVVEMFGHLGFDFVMIDCEHGSLDLQTIQELVRAAEVTGMTGIARVPYLHPKIISRTLDIGAHGVQVPMVNNNDDLATVVEAAKYWPIGKRGMAMGRCADYGMTMTWTDYLEKANEETMIVIHLETPEALANLPEMLTAEQVDVFFIGPMDLSQSLGYPGQPSHPVVQGVIDQAIAQIRDAGRTAGIFAFDAPTACRYRDKGVQYLLTSADCLIQQIGRDYLYQVRRKT